MSFARRALNRDERLVLVCRQCARRFQAAHPIGYTIIGYGHEERDVLRCDCGGETYLRQAYEAERCG